MKRSRGRTDVWDSFIVEGELVRCLKCDTLLDYHKDISNLIRHLAKCHASPLSEEDGDAKGHGEAAGAQEVSPEPGEKKRYKRSSVWDVFIRVNEEVRCTLCDLRLKYMGSTTNMIYHIERKHRKTKPEDEMPHVGPSYSDLTEVICRTIEKDMLPVSIVSGDGFRELLSHVAPSFKMPSTGEIELLMEDHYHQKVCKLLALLTTPETVSLTVECWAALPTESYVTITCHFISSDWKATSAVLVTQSLSATKNNLTDIIVNAVECWGITGRVVACCHNEHSISPAQGYASATWESLVCFTSMLQMAVSDGLCDGILSVVVAAGKLVKYFQHTSPSMVLGHILDEMNLPQRPLIQSSKSRWETISDMFERLMEQRWAIECVLTDRTATNRQEAQYYKIQEDYWEIIENITPILATLRSAATVMSAETVVSISNIYPITFSLLQTHLAEKEHDIKEVSEFKFKVRESLKKHMEVESNDLSSKPALIASMLDPRHKHLSFLTPTRRLAAKVKLHEMVSKIDVPTTAVSAVAIKAEAKAEIQEVLVTAPASQVAVAKQKQGDAKNAMMFLLGENYCSSYADDSEAQVDIYLRDTSPSLDVHPLDWWKLNGPRFPLLAKLARRYLCIPGVAVQGDQRPAGEGGETFAKMRARLSPGHVDTSLFLNKNASLL